MHKLDEFIYISVGVYVIWLPSERFISARYIG